MSDANQLIGRLKLFSPHIYLRCRKEGTNLLNAAANTLKNQAAKIEAYEQERKDLISDMHTKALQIEALEKDAKRLAYLDSLATYSGRSFMGGTHHLEFTHDFDSPNSSFYAAIDAAIAGEAT